MSLPTKFSAALRVNRALAGWSQVLLAEKIGVHVNSIGAWERGDGEPSLEVAGRAAAAFGLDEIGFLSGEETVEINVQPFKRGRGRVEPGKKAV